MGVSLLNFLDAPGQNRVTLRRNEIVKGRRRHGPPPSSKRQSSTRPFVGSARSNRLGRKSGSTAFGCHLVREAEASWAVSLCTQPYALHRVFGTVRCA